MYEGLQLSWHVYLVVSRSVETVQCHSKGVVWGRQRCRWSEVECGHLPSGEEMERNK